MTRLTWSWPRLETYTYPPKSYRGIRRSFKDGCYVDFLDQIEWRMVNETPTPVAILELTRSESNGDPSKRERQEQIPLGGVLDKFHDNPRGDFVLEISERLGVSVFAVVFEKDLKRFWVRNLSDLDLDKENDRWI